MNRLANLDRLALMDAEHEDIGEHAVAATLRAADADYRLYAGAACHVGELDFEGVDAAVTDAKLTARQSATVCYSRSVTVPWIG